MSIKLIVNADDFGLHAGINKGVIDAFENGILRSASVSPVGEAFLPAVEYLQSHPKFRVGIHLSLIEERALLPNHLIPTITNEKGFFMPWYSSFIKNFWRVNVEEIDLEWRAQIERVLSTGIAPTHLNSHQHLHVIPPLFRLIQTLADEFSIPHVRVPAPGILDVFSGGPKMWGLKILSEIGIVGSSGKARGSSIGMKGLKQSGHLNEKKLCHILQNLKPGVHELLCHPAHPDFHMEKKYGHWKFEWEKETAALISPQVKQIINDRQIMLTDFSALRDS